MRIDPAHLRWIIPAAIAAPVAAVAQLHGVGFWQTFLGKPLGWAVSLTWEAFAVWAWWAWWNWGAGERGFKLQLWAAPLALLAGIEVQTALALADDARLAALPGIAQVGVWALALALVAVFYLLALPALSTAGREWRARPRTPAPPRAPLREARAQPDSARTQLAPAHTRTTPRRVVYRNYIQRHQLDSQRQVIERSGVKGTTLREWLDGKGTAERDAEIRNALEA